MTISTQLSLHVASDETAMAREAARLLALVAQEAVALRGVFTLALSGGKTPVPLYRLLASPAWAQAVDWHNAQVYWADERCVKPESEDSNYGLVRRELLAKVEATRYYRMKGEEHPEKAAREY
jgi:6-phosphogluconolactonase